MAQRSTATPPASPDSKPQICPSSYFYETADALAQAAHQQAIGDNVSCQLTCYGILEAQNLSPYWLAKTHVLLAATEGLENVVAQLQVAVKILEDYERAGQPLGEFDLKAGFLRGVLEDFEKNLRAEQRPKAAGKAKGNNKQKKTKQVIAKK